MFNNLLLATRKSGIWCTLTFLKQYVLSMLTSQLKGEGEEGSLYLPSSGFLKIQDTGVTPGPKMCAKNMGTQKSLKTMIVSGL